MLTTETPRSRRALRELALRDTIASVLLTSGFSRREDSGGWGAGEPFTTEAQRAQRRGVRITAFSVTSVLLTRSFLSRREDSRRAHLDDRLVGEPYVTAHLTASTLSL